jgi:hypothetical protein
VAEVNAARDRHVDIATGQLTAGLFNGDKGAGAGGDDRVSGAADVQAVGDPRGDEVWHQPDGRIGAIGAGVALEVAFDLVQRLVVDAGQEPAQAQKVDALISLASVEEKGTGHGDDRTALSRTR